jgi:hypothetical protein
VIIFTDTHDLSEDLMSASVWGPLQVKRYEQRDEIRLEEEYRARVYVFE